MVSVAVLALSGAAWGERLSVKAPLANIRNGPGDQYDVMWQIGKYHPVEIIQKSGSWYRFRDSDKDEGWIHDSMLDRTATVVTIKEDCPIYSGAGTKFKVLFSAEKGVPFKVLGKKGGWINIQHEDGDKGWIQNTLVW